MATRSELTLMALAAACAIAIATPAFAQTGAEYPRTGPGISTVPGGGMGGSIGGASLSAPAQSGSGTAKTTEIPYDGPDDDLPPTARPPTAACITTPSDVTSDLRVWTPARSNRRKAI